MNDKQHGLQDSVIFIKKILNEVFEKPKIITCLVKNDKEGKYRALEDTLCTTFFEDIIADETQDDDLLRLLGELLEV